MHAPASTYLPRYYVLECTRTGRPCMSILCVCVCVCLPFLLALVKSVQWIEIMIRFYKRLQVYVLSSLLIIITLWILVPHTRSQNISRLSIRRSLPPPDENNNIIRNEEDQVEFSDADLEPLRNLFKKTDTTADGLLSLNELTWGIQKSVSKHVQSAMRNNFKQFFRLDRINHNGQVEWDEWLSQFYHENGIKKKQDLSNTERSVKEKLAAAKAAWSEAARSNPDA